MSENFNSHIACEGTDNDINWVCKVCKDLPNYAGMYLYQREREKNQLKNVKDRRADLILLKYYYALLHLLDKIHELHEYRKNDPGNELRFQKPDAIFAFGQGSRETSAGTEPDQ